jgi:hypothetical protein
MVNKKWFRNMVFQFNADAENEAIRDEVQKRGSHSKRAILSFPLNEDGSALDPSYDQAAVELDVVSELRSGL